MDPTTVGLIGLAAFFVLALIGLPLAYCGLLVGFLGLWQVVGLQAGLSSVGTGLFGSVVKYVLTPVPLFILMGEFMIMSGVAAAVFRLARAWVGWLPGGLASAVCLGGAGLGAACGSSLAATAVMTKVALPELEKQRYSPKLSAGSITAAGTLAATIPPSILIVIYGIMTNQGVGKMLLAGFLPGILTALVFVTMITVRSLRNPAMGPAVKGVDWAERGRSLLNAWGIVVIGVVVMGGIYTGIFTPTEAGGIGAAVTLVYAYALGRFTREGFVSALIASGLGTAKLFIITAGILLFTRFLAITQVIDILSNFISGMSAPPIVILIGMLLVVLMLGMFLDSIGILLLTLPIFYPASVALGFDPLVFGIVFILTVEIGLLTPPVGMNCILFKSLTPQISSWDVYRGAFPFVLAMLVVIALLITFPQIVTAIPNMM